MRKTRLLAAAGGVLALAACSGDGAEVAIDNDDIGGVVSSSAGPEAGVWVIAETDDLPTKFVRSVVTDDQGRYVIPDLPAANYRVFARGYGLVDSPKAEARPGTQLNLEPTVAPDEATAAKYYPSLYWFALLNIPTANEFPGTGEAEGGNGIAQNVRAQGHWIHYVKSTGCYSCHHFGSEYMRTVPEAIKAELPGEPMGQWTRRVQTGQAATSMIDSLPRMGSTRALKEYASYTDRIAAGELPFEKPTRPEGVER